MARARSGKVVQSKINMLLFGLPFSGKSTIASQSAYLKRPDGKPFRVLYLDPESGSIDDYLDKLEQDGVNLSNIYIVYTQSVGEVREYIRKSKSNEDLYELDEDGNETNDIVLDGDNEPFRADMIVVDGSSILNLTTKQGLVEFSKKRAKVRADGANLIGDERLVKVEGAGLEIKDYQTVNFKGQDLILDLMGSGKHFIVTARETDEQISIKKPNGEEARVSTGKKIADGFKGMDYNVKTVCRMVLSPETGIISMIVEKDRTLTHKAMTVIEDPTLLDWQQVIDKTAKREDFIIHNNLSKSVDIEQKIYEKELLGEDSSLGSSQTANSSNDSGEIESLQKELMEMTKQLTLPQKNKAKKLLSDAKLDSKFEKVTDIEKLQQSLGILKSVTE